MSHPVVDLFLDANKKVFDESFKMWERVLAIPNVPKHALRVRVGTTPNDVVYEEDSLRLLRYRNDAITCKESVLICYALVNRPYILDLQPTRSVVEKLLKRGLNVYLIDWGVPTAADRS